MKKLLKTLLDIAALPVVYFGGFSDATNHRSPYLFPCLYVGVAIVVAAVLAVKEARKAKAAA
ncbi:hypothetical protein [Caballeronia fortuita]|uniref:hypothetical protein n=1 Tax=Caballeronia fortuita TaxID=1777138 RepID=UPI0007721F5C|nr:hypothetical protein [Caballeronia fortuita]